MGREYKMEREIREGVWKWREGVMRRGGKGIGNGYKGMGSEEEKGRERKGE